MTVLSQHPAVRETVVIAHKNISDGKRLIAYVALNLQDSQIPERQLQDEQVGQWQTLYDQTYRQTARTQHSISWAGQQLHRSADPGRANARVDQ